MIIQPLLENAIKHGVADRAQGGCVKVSASVEGKWLEVTVEDDGKGTNRDMLTASKGIGIGNLRARLEQLYRGDHSFRISTAPGRGFSVSIIIPFNEYME